MAAVEMLTREDLDRMPDDGNRYELIEGEIVVSPSPRSRHQVVLARLFRLLDDACQPGLMVLFAPLDVQLEEHSVVEPDLIVFDETALGQRGLDTPPLLAVEILSPSTRSLDLVRKKRLFERTGVASYWVIDPGDADDEVSMTAWELRESGYEAVAAIGGDESWTARAPFEVTVVPSDLAR